VDAPHVLDVDAHPLLAVVGMGKRASIFRPPPRVIYTFWLYNVSIILHSFFFNVNFVFVDHARATPDPHTATRAQLRRVPSATPMEPPLVKTMVVRLSCLSPCLLV
jgi:hypothetical protein